jgi:hypothetical protein
MTTALFAAGVITTLLVLIVLLAARRGRVEARLQLAQENLDVRDRQLEAANNRARDDGELVRRLRSGEF